jgi:nicotinamide-nucleotide amidase
MPSNLVQKVVKLLLHQNRTLATAESCTGGLIAKMITDVSGSSAIFIGGVVSYSNAMKIKWLHVQEKTLAEFGAVSAETVNEMLRGIQQATGCELALAVSGVAGPTGGSPEKPVGTVFIGWQFQNRAVVERFHFAGDRQSVRNQAAEMALARLLEFLAREPHS